MRSFKVTGLIILLIGIFINACQDKKADNTNDSKPDQEINTDSVENLLNTIPDPLEIDTASLSQILNTEPGEMKIGFINSVEITSKLPSVRSVEAQLQSFAQQLESELQRKSKEFQDKYTFYMQDTSNMTESIIQMRTKELEDLQATIYQLQYNSEQELAKQRQKLFQPIMNKIQKAIEEVASEQGFTHIHDASTGSLVFGAPEYNITDVVLQKLGVN